MTDTKEKPWNMHSWEDLRRELAGMQRKSKLYGIVRAEVEKRGHWKKRKTVDKKRTRE